MVHASDLEALLADREMADLFVSEAREHLASIETLVLELEQAPADRSLVDAVYRSFHTIKGNAYSIGARAVGKVAHGIESLLEEIRSDQRRLGQGEVDQILKAVDRLKETLDILAQGLHVQATPAGTAVSADDHQRFEEPASIKVDTRRLDTLVDMVGELMILQSMIREGCPALGESDQVVARQFSTFGR